MLCNVFFCVMGTDKYQPIYVGRLVHLFSLYIIYRCTFLLAREDVHTIHDILDINCTLLYGTNHIDP